MPSASPGQRLTRPSNGLKEFLWQLEGIGQGTLADFGAVSQATVMYFIEHRFKVYTEDLLAGWGAFLEREAAQASTVAPENRPDSSPRARAERFLASNLRYTPDSFDAVLLWDVLDYMDREVARLFLTRVLSLMREGGVLLGVFHTKAPEQFYRYRVLDAQNLELVPAAALVPHNHIYQNREIQDLFERFRSSKMFVSRDQVREGVFIK